MSEEADVIRRWVDAWNNADLDTFMRFFDSDADLIPDPSWPESGPFRGQRAIREFSESFREAWTGNRAVIADLRAAGETVVAQIGLHGRGQASGIDAEISFTCVSQVEHDKIVHQRWYLKHAEALDAAGFSE
jgi:hypothetical protein